MMINLVICKNNEILTGLLRILLTASRRKVLKSLQAFPYADVWMRRGCDVHASAISLAAEKVSIYVQIRSYNKYIWLNLQSYMSIYDVGRSYISSYMIIYSYILYHIWTDMFVYDPIWLRKNIPNSSPKPNMYHHIYMTVYEIRDNIWPAFAMGTEITPITRISKKCREELCRLNSPRVCRINTFVVFNSW